MACWIGKVIIIRNNGTILFGNADILPIIGDDDEAEQEAEEEIDGEDVVVDEPVSANRKKRKKNGAKPKSKKR
ncbi:hypothetical protein [Paenibacillus montanisoli]|uniref:Uncharacterized protein n=1 Tax=Paenibacillus montanisoli TaxID=2081970 RepID=A0A328U737_9BACL|nr:hypothetical protein [Paenibacillus montanisoli]RAP77583.1 hypothetical protein DL346_03645 [Paenibacillus montanisoli]